MCVLCVPSDTIADGVGEAELTIQLRQETGGTIAKRGRKPRVKWPLGWKLKVQSLVWKMALLRVCAAGKSEAGGNRRANKGNRWNVINRPLYGLEPSGRRRRKQSKSRA